MNSKPLVGMMRLAIIAGLLILIAGGNTTKAQVEESLSLNFDTLIIDYSKGNRVEILVTTPDSQKFLSDPINTLKRQGVAVPRAAEAPWRAFTGALQRLATSHRTKAKGSRRSSMNREILTYSFDKITVLGTIAGDWNGDGTITARARKASAGFLDDPVVTLRAGRVEVPAADERAWRQLAEALKELQGVYSRIRTKRNAEGQQAPSGLNGKTGVEGRQAVAPRGWDPQKKTAVAGPSETSQEKASAGDPDRPFILGRIPNNKGNVPGSGPDRMKVKGASDQSVTGRVTGIAIDPGNSTAPVQGGFGNDRIGVIGYGNNIPSGKPSNQRPRAAQPDLVIKQFLFPPPNDKALRVQVSNDGSAAAGASRLIITVRKINGTAVGRQTHVNIPALASGKKVWLVIDAKSILPNNVALQSTTFKLNADGTGIVAESDETNNEVWHNL